MTCEILDIIHFEQMKQTQSLSRNLVDRDIN